MSADIGRRTLPYREECARNLERRETVLSWLIENPNCESDLRRAKLKAYDALEREFGVVMEQWEQVFESWMKERVRAQEALR